MVHAAGEGRAGEVGSRGGGVRQRESRAGGWKAAGVACVVGKGCVGGRVGQEATGWHRLEGGEVAGAVCYGDGWGSDPWGGSTECFRALKLLQSYLRPLKPG